MDPKAYYSPNQATQNPSGIPPPYPFPGGPGAFSGPSNPPGNVWPGPGQTPTQQYADEKSYPSYPGSVPPTAQYPGTRAPPSNYPIEKVLFLPGPARPNTPAMYYLGVQIPHMHLHVNVGDLPPNLPEWVKPTVARLASATKGSSSRHEVLISTLVGLDPTAVDIICVAYEVETGIPLLQFAESVSNSHFALGLYGLTAGPIAFEVRLIERNLVIPEKLLIEVLFGRTNSEINLLKQGFRYNHITRRRQLEDELNRGMTPTILQMFYLALSERRTDENTPVDYQLLQTDVASIASYIQSKDSGTSIAYLSSILITRNQHHLAELAKAYAKIYGIKLSETLAKTYTNWVKEAFVYIAQGAEGDGYGVDRDADMIHQAMVGMGTKDEQLIWRIIRAHWNRPRFQCVKQAYEAHHGKSLLNAVKSEVKGHYRDLMCAVITLPA